MNRSFYTKALTLQKIIISPKIMPKYEDILVIEDYKDE